MKRRILIVDDEPAVRDLLSEIVTTCEDEALTVGSAREAISMLARERISLILLDLAMPEITGDQFLSFIRKKGFKTPVVVVSAHVDEEVEARLKEAGISGIVHKPFEVAEVIDEMEKALYVEPG